MRFIFPVLLLLRLPCFGLIVIATLTAGASVIPSNRNPGWTGSIGFPGGIPNSSNMTVSATLASGSSLATINNAIAACPSNQVVVLQDGVYNLAGTLTLNQDGVVLRGQSTNAVLKFTSGGIYVAKGNGVYNALRGNFGGTTATVTAGWVQGSTSLTLSTVSGLTVGNTLFVDQSNDGNQGAGTFINSYGYEECSGLAGPRDNSHNMCQFFDVVAINGSVVTVSPAVAYPYASQGSSPGAIWCANSSWIKTAGVENLTVDGSGTTGQGAYAANICLEGSKYCWIKNVISLNGYHAHFSYEYGFFRGEVRHSWLYGTQGASSLSYGIVTTWGSGVLSEDNIFEKLVGSFLPGGSSSLCVCGYCYETNNYYASANNFLMAGMQPHDSHCYMNLMEGNFVPKFAGDFIHGSESHNLVFRNRMTGYAPYSYPNGPTTQNLQCEWWDITNRECSSVGNVLGYSGIYSVLISTAGNVNAGDVEIYRVGLVNHGYNGGGCPSHFDVTAWSDDSITRDTFFRHLDYDMVTSAIFYNSTNADVTLPDSFYLTSKPVFFGILNYPPYNPTNGSSIVSMGMGSATNIPAGYRRWFGVDPPQPGNGANLQAIATGKIQLNGKVYIGQ